MNDAIFHMLQLSVTDYQNVYYFAVILAIIIAIFIVIYVVIGEEKEEEE